MGSQIVVATDFSPRSDRALRRATMLAKQFGMTVGLVNVVDEDQPQHLIETQTRVAKSTLAECVHTLGELDGVKGWAEVVTGDVFSGILQVAERTDPAMIVLGPHRRQLRDVFIGTTAERTIAHSRHPVLMAAGLPSARYSSALLALDMDDASRAAVRHMLEWSIVPPSELLAMHAYDAPAKGMMKLGMSPVEAVDHYVIGEKRRADGLFRAMLRDLGARSTRRMLVPMNGRAGRTILESARDVNAPLVVVGSSQKRGLKRLLLGSVAEDVLGDADLDVLVIPQVYGHQDHVFTHSGAEGTSTG